MLVHLRMNFFSINIYKIIARSAKITCFGDWKLKMLERGREGGLQGLLSCLFKSEIRENILLDFFIMQEIYAIVLVTVYNQGIIFWLSLTNKWKCLVPNKINLFFLQTTWQAATAVTATTTTTAKWPSSYWGDPKS